MPRYFTREEAEAFLPRVEPLLREMQQLQVSLAESETRLTAIRRAYMGNGHTRQDEVAELQRRVSAAREGIVGHIQTINEMGILVKDLVMGLIDFPMLRAGHEVYLCWRLGEGGRIAWWHEIEAGFLGRQSLDED
jgi:hypothetical protein